MRNDPEASSHANETPQDSSISRAEGETTSQIPEIGHSAADEDQMLKRLIDGRYRIVKIIDTGGMASVYRAHDERLGRDVALKMMHPHLANTTSLVERFEAEARSAARLMHPAIVQIFDQGTWRRRPYLVMEFINGPNLRQLLSHEGTLPLGRALEITEQVLQALQAAHEMQIIHRDIKPENILLTPSGQVKVADFGLAHAVNQATGTTTGSVMGTVTYLAPELISETTSDARCDVYSVGIMAYELISGLPPFQGDTAIRTAWQHVSEDVPPLSAKVPWIPSEVDDLVAALTARNAQDRPVDAGAALQLVKAVIDCLSPELLKRRAQRPASETLEKETERTPLGKGGTARLPVLPVASPQVPAAPIRPHNPNLPADNPSTSIPAHPEKSLTVVETADAVASPEAPAKRGKKKRWIAAVITGILVIVAALAGWYFTLGPGGRVAVPNVEGKTVAQAREMLINAQFKVETKREYSDTIAADKATRTNPKAGQKAKKNSQVELYISRGIEYVKVPDLKGKEGAEAGKLLKAAKLKLAGSSEEYSDEVEKGKIIATDPEGGTTLRHHSGVKVTVSKGKEPITLPDFAGKSEEEVAKTLSDLKLEMAKTTEFSDSVPRGQIIGQEPAAGTTVYHHDQIKVRVSQGPEMIEVPNVTALSMGQAKKKLTDLGFQVQVQKQLLGIAPNRVYSQSPAGGTKLKSGSTVTLTYV